MAGNQIHFQFSNWEDYDKKVKILYNKMEENINIKKKIFFLLFNYGINFNVYYS